MGTWVQGHVAGHALRSLWRAASVGWLAAALWLGHPAPAAALTIHPAFHGLDGSEAQLFRDAFAWWEAAIHDPVLVVLEVDKVDLPGLTLARTSDLSEGADGRPAAATIEFAAGGGGLGWYVDPSLTDNDEFTASALSSYHPAVRGGPADLRFDLWTIANHEIAHALGFSTDYAAFASHVVDQPDGSRTYVGSGFTAPLSPVGSATHIDDTVYRNDLMGTFLTASARRDVSTIDLRILGDAFNYDVTLPPPGEVPEPAGVTLLLVGLASRAMRGPARLRRRAPRAPSGGDARPIRHDRSGATVRFLMRSRFPAWLRAAILRCGTVSIVLPLLLGLVTDRAAAAGLPDQLPAIRWDSGRLTASLVDAPLRDVLEQIAALSGLEIVGLEKATGTVSAQFENQTVPEAIQVLMKGFNTAVIGPDASGTYTLRIIGGPGAAAGTSGRARVPITLRTLDLPGELPDPDAATAGDDEDDAIEDARDQREELAELEADGSLRPDATVNDLREAADHENPLVRMRALARLNALDPARATRLLVGALDDDSDAVVEAVREILERRTDSQSLKMLGEALGPKGNFGPRIEALRILAFRADPAAIPYLKPVTGDRNEMIHAAATELLAELERRQAAARQ